MILGNMKPDLVNEEERTLKVIDAVVCGAKYLSASYQNKINKYGSSGPGLPHTNEGVQQVNNEFYLNAEVFPFAITETGTIHPKTISWLKESGHVTETIPLFSNQLM